MWINVFGKIEIKYILRIYFTTGKLRYKNKTYFYRCGVQPLWHCRPRVVREETNTLHLSSPSVFSGGPVTRSLVLCICLVDRCLSFCPFSLGHCVVCSSIYGFWLSLWYLRFTDSDYPFGILDLRILITPLVS